MLIFKSLKAVHQKGWLFFVTLVDTTKSTIMKNKYLIAVLLVIFFSGFTILNAQFTDDMEYPNGIPTSSSWWDCTAGCPIIVGPDAGHNSNYAGYIPGDGITDVILNLGNKILVHGHYHFICMFPRVRRHIGIFRERFRLR
jgi:hypothetical protein